MLIQLPSVHAGIEGAPAFAAESLLLSFSRAYDPSPDLRGSFSGALGGDLSKFDGRNFNMDIDAI